MNPKSIATDYSKMVWQEKNLKALDAMVHEHVVVHSLIGDFHGREALRRVIQVWFDAFPDLDVKNLFSISENDLVAIIWQANGTHLGPFKHLEPTGKKVFYSGASIYRVQNGKIFEYWGFLDLQHVLSQLT